jgi:L-alanine-DL-glutamate epimerase-like enolase superfamily enzyme
VNRELTLTPEQSVSGVQDALPCLRSRPVFEQANFRDNRAPQGDQYGSSINRFERQLLEHGWAIADRPGVGIEWDEDAVAHYRYEL